MGHVFAEDGNEEQEADESRRGIEFGSFEEQEAQDGEQDAFVDYASSGVWDTGAVEGACFELQVDQDI